MFFKLLLFLLIVLPKVGPIWLPECQNISIDRFYYCNNKYNYNYNCQFINHIAERQYARIHVKITYSNSNSKRKRKDCIDSRKRRKKFILKVGNDLDLGLGLGLSLGDYINLGQFIECSQIIIIFKSKF